MNLGSERFKITIVAGDTLNSHGGEYEGGESAIFRRVVCWNFRPLNSRFLSQSSSTRHHDDGDSKYLRNVGKILTDYTSQHLKNQSQSTFVFRH
jgi:hypothetical protein